MKPPRDGRGDARRGAPRVSGPGPRGHAWAPSVRPPRAGMPEGMRDGPRGLRPQPRSAARRLPGSLRERPRARAVTARGPSGPQNDRSLSISLQVSVPKFGKIPWLSEASLVNKPLVLSLPKRYPHASATFLISSKKDMNLPILFQVPDVLSKARRLHRSPVLVRNKQLCSTCQERKMVQPRTVIIPHNLKPSFENFMTHRMMNLHPPKAQTVAKHSHNDISTDSVHYRLPILGPRTAVFHGLLADTYATMQETQLSSLPRKEPVGKTMKQ
ncbi:uncharacterized protein C1orf105 homolog isoform X1 [Mustela putorius furo]|uniref:Uncharacterized protein C1orf105 homolog isoform X1 n=1 Tax=Mustela putorius furo TaxID=9669 RepID=A0A8U0SXB5_MUSPF|nr:uncharacterized protein C1orf105 homolog isoform X1 [Mustela putorius furo]